MRKIIKAIEMKKSNTINMIVPNAKIFELEMMFSIKGIVESLSLMFLVVLNIFNVKTKVTIVAAKIITMLI